MDLQQLAVWRDAALILLVLQAFVVGIALVAVLYRCWHTLRQLEARLRPILLRARLELWHFDTVLQQALRAIAAPFVWLRSVASGLIRASQVLSRR